jgi:hypothetical protein
MMQEDKSKYAEPGKAADPKTHDASVTFLATLGLIEKGTPITPK